MINFNEKHKIDVNGKYKTHYIQFINNTLFMYRASILAPLNNPPTKKFYQENIEENLFLFVLNIIFFFPFSF